MITVISYFFQSAGQNSKEKKKKKKAAGKEGGEGSVVSDRDGGLGMSSQVDEYEHDTSDEEVRICPACSPGQEQPVGFCLSIFP